MNSGDMLSLSLKNLLRRKTRSVLAILGVVIGICAIVTMLSIGFGLQQSFRASVENMGNLRIVTIYANESGSSASGHSKKARLDDKTLREIGDLTGVMAFTPTVSVTMTFAVGKEIARDVMVMGVKPEVFETFGYTILEGRNLTSGDKLSAVFGNAIPKNFLRARPVFGLSEEEDPGKKPADLITDKMIATPDPDYKRTRRTTDPNVKKVDYKTYKVKGIGVLSNPDDFSTAYSVFMPLDAVKKISEELAKSEKKVYDRHAPYKEALIYVDTIENVKPITETIRAMGFQTMSMTEYLESSKKQMNMIQMVLGGIGAVSLLVAALGITNTMVMSIYERTKEIGVMKVIGANLPDIRKMFLIEAALIGFVGGLVGIALSYMFSAVMNIALAPSFTEGGGNMSVIPFWLPLAALGFSTAVGVAAGYSPARRAMNLSALESLRNE